MLHCSSVAMWLPDMQRYGADMFDALVAILARTHQAQRCSMHIVKCRALQRVGEEHVGLKGVT